MKESTKKPYMGGEETGFPEIERSVTNKDITNAIALFSPQYSEFYGSKPGAVDPAVQKWLQQSEFKKPYGKPNEETPSYPEMEYNFNPPQPPVFPPVSPPPGRPRFLVIFDLEIKDTVCPGRWTTIELFTTEPIVSVELISPNPGQEIRKAGPKNDPWRKIAVFIPEIYEGESINVQAFMESVEGFTGFSNTTVPIESLESYECPSVFLEFEITMGIYIDPSTTTTIKRTLVWDLWREELATISGITWPLADNTALNAWKQSKGLTLINNQTENWIVSRTEATFNSISGCNSPSCKGCADAYEDCSATTWSGCGPVDCDRYVLQTETLACDLGDEDPPGSGLYPDATNGVMNAEFGSIDPLTYTGISGGLPITKYFNGDITYYSGLTSTSVMPYGGWFESVYNGDVATIPCAPPLDPGCLANADTPICKWGTGIDIDKDKTFYLEYDGVNLITESKSWNEEWSEGGGFDVYGPGVIFPFRSKWNNNLASPIYPDFSVNLFIFLGLRVDGPAPLSYTHKRAAYVSTYYSNAGVNSLTNFGIDVLGDTRQSSLESSINGILDLAESALETPGDVRGLSIGANFWYGTY